MADVKFDEADSTKISHMYSPQREEVEMDYQVDTKGNIEVWLQRLVDGMKDTVCAIIKAANRNVYNQELEPFIFGHPAQIALLGIQFMWTADTQTALTNAKTDKGIMSKNMKKTDAVLKEMVTITVKTSLTKIQRTNLETCITVHMHQKESTEDLVKKKIKDPTDFEWLKQVLPLPGMECPGIHVFLCGGDRVSAGQATLRVFAPITCSRQPVMLALLFSKGYLVVRQIGQEAVCGLLTSSSV